MLSKVAEREREKECLQHQILNITRNVGTNHTLTVNLTVLYTIIDISRSNTFITHVSRPPSIAPSVTLTSHVITGSVVPTLSYTLFTTVETVPFLLTFCSKKKKGYTSVNSKIKFTNLNDIS